MSTGRTFLIMNDSDGSSPPLTAPAFWSGSHAPTVSVEGRRRPSPDTQGPSETPRSVLFPVRDSRVLDLDSGSPTSAVPRGQKTTRSTGNSEVQDKSTGTGVGWCR